jgi:hypothetical protein
MITSLQVHNVPGMREDNQKDCCPWCLGCSIKEGIHVWKVTKYNNVHNHEVKPAITELTARLQYIPVRMQESICGMARAGIEPYFILVYCQQNYPGFFKHHTFSLDNVRTVYKDIAVVDKDAKTSCAKALSVLAALHRDDPNWVVSIRLMGDVDADVDEDRKCELKSVLWMSPRQVELGARYHYILIHDNTYK